MLPLPLLPYDCSVVQDKLVDKQARFHYEGNRDRDSARQALVDAAAHGAFSAEYIANLLQFRRVVSEPSPRHLPRNQDLLDIELPDPDLAVYDRRLSPGQSRRFSAIHSPVGAETDQALSSVRERL